MMHPSEDYKKKGKPLWNETYKKINEELGCGTSHNTGEDLRRN